MTFSQRSRFALLGIAASIMIGAPALADNDKGTWYISPMFSFVDDADRRNADDDFAGGQLGFGYHLSDHWALEFGLFAANLEDRYLGNKQKLSGVGIDLIREFNLSERFSPYALVGIGYQYTNPELTNNSDDVLGSVGLGLMTKLNDSGLALRTEARLRGVADTPQQNDMYYSAGLRIPLGKREPTTPPDADGDGVSNVNDRCPNTPAGAAVGADGCELDSDGDGVVDSQDRCPNTPAGTPVDANGCKVVEKDSDGDGVPDARDECPNTPSGAKVDAKGCELDDDSDGVANSKDRCPNTRAGARIDVYGCEIKETINLPGVQFELSSDQLRQESTRVLNDAAQTLKNNPGLRVEVAGFTDSSGPAAYNQSLSQQRAAAVAAYLAARGVDAGRMSAKGYGEADPIADNSTREGRARNRRVELKVLN